MQAKGGPPIPRLRYTFEQLANVRRFHGCTMSSDCKQAAIIADLDGQMNLWLVPAAGGFPVQLTFFKDQTVRDVQWSPVANQIAFQADSQGNELYQLYLLDKDGKTRAELGVLPDGTPRLFLLDAQGTLLWSVLPGAQPPPVTYVPVPLPALPATETSTTIVSHIDGTFEGCTGETIFNLENGQIWQQARYSYRYHYAYRPEVTISPTPGGYYHKMTVAGVDEAIYVIRLK